MMLVDLDFFDDEMGSVSTSQAETKTPIARAGSFRRTLRAGAVAFTVAVMSVIGSFSSIASVDGRAAAVATARAMHRFGAMPVSLRRDAAASRALLRPVVESRDVSDPDYGF